MSTDKPVSPERIPQFNLHNNTLATASIEDGALTVWLHETIFEGDEAAALYEWLGRVLGKEKGQDRPSDARDAARYRWLRDRGFVTLGEWTRRYHLAQEVGSLDISIDAALAAAKGATT